ncbi:LPS export ABC transporter periplasmic protein LptC [Candidatus Omnitrophota bacterium]
MRLSRNRKILFIVIPILLIVLAVVYFKPKSPPKVEAKSDSGTMSIEEALDIKQEVFTFKIEGYDKDKKVKWGLEGESAKVVEDKIDIRNLKAVYKGGDMNVTLLANNAVFDKKSQNIELNENIIGKTSDGMEFVTDHANWDAKKETVTTDSHVIVKRENVICRGKGLLALPMEKWVSFESDVDVDFGGNKRITCDGPFEIDHMENVAIFNNNVKIADKDSDMFTDKLTVYLKPETNEVDRVVTEGNVKVVHKGELDKIGDMDIGKVAF